ncbi:septal ring lipoprotein RlpA [Marinobacterium nitratireducens]|uniref:Endolytic peptidoglycan transglycosylase RlpA n=1 Tax=Marinobacterium nitratireducens TaxID=518897 RepID=A0A918DRB2_9GAMM|nr:septal ring lytic transglycosylase RlpA family protein [Marinobacterium nitratireducens]GGO78651.1 septal ring lipoprotein RlpA [Marinobacterium nitratireducens]
MKRPASGLALMLAFGLLAGCAGKVKDEQAGQSGEASAGPNAGRYALEHDVAPKDPIDVSRVPDAVPRIEPKSRGGNRSPYEVFGRTYHVMNSASGYRERGTASWYGRKFHGYETSNGEVYDMYSMTAAHKSLPLPSYVRVTNLDNGRQVVVRVNDRGPFHQGRIIDLSYAAAHRLGMLGKGTARVEVTALDARQSLSSGELVKAGAAALESESKGAAVSPPAVKPRAPAPVSAQGRYLQVGAFADVSAADRIGKRLGPLSPGLDLRVTPVQLDGRTLYRVQLGPVPDTATEQRLMRQLADAGYGAARPVDLP